MRQPIIVLIARHDDLVHPTTGYLGTPMSRRNLPKHVLSPHQELRTKSRCKCTAGVAISFALSAVGEHAGITHHVVDSRIHNIAVGNDCQRYFFTTVDQPIRMGLVPKSTEKFAISLVQSSFVSIIPNKQIEKSSPCTSGLRASGLSVRTTGKASELQKIAETL